MTYTHTRGQKFTFLIGQNDNVNLSLVSRPLNHQAYLLTDVNGSMHQNNHMFDFTKPNTNSTSLLNDEEILHWFVTLKPEATIVNIGLYETLNEVWAPKQVPQGKTAARFYFDRIKQLVASFEDKAKALARERNIPNFSSYICSHKFYVLHIPLINEKQIRRSYPHATISAESLRKVRSILLHKMVLIHEQQEEEIRMDKGT